MAGFRQMADMAYSDDEILDRRMPQRPEPPEYPTELSFSVSQEVVERCGGEGECRPGDTVRFAAMAEATAMSRKIDGCRIEVELTMLSLGDGQLTDLDEGERPMLCLLDGTMERLDLDDEAQSGDLLHLIGTVRVESADESRYSAGRRLTLQIVEMCVEDEDQEDGM